MFWKIYLVAFFVFLIIDMIWLGFLAKKFYKKNLGELMRKKVNWVAALLFYFLFVFALLFFVVIPAIESSSWIDAFLYGAFFGMISYATYDLTNLATLKNWSINVTIIDILWGSLLGAMVSLITYLISVNFIL